MHAADFWQVSCIICLAGCCEKVDGWFLFGVFLWFWFSPTLNYLWAIPSCFCVTVCHTTSVVTHPTNTSVCIVVTDCEAEDELKLKDGNHIGTDLSVFRTSTALTARNWLWKFEGCRLERTLRHGMMAAAEWAERQRDSVWWTGQEHCNCRQSLLWLWPWVECSSTNTVWCCETVHTDSWCML